YVSLLRATLERLVGARLEPFSRRLTRAADDDDDSGGIVTIWRLAVASTFRWPDSVAFVLGVDDFPPPLRRLGRIERIGGDDGDDDDDAGLYSFPGRAVAPPFLRDFYGLAQFGRAEPHTNQSSSAVAEFEEDYFSNSDLATFLRNYSLPVVEVA